MNAVAILLTLIAGGVLLVLWVLRTADRRAERAERARLAARQPEAPPRFSPDMVAALPAPARRYFERVIAPGTPLLTMAEIEMGGRFGLGSREAPGYRPMQARQILAAPAGFLWSMHTRGGLPISGSDSGRWTRFRILWLIPVARRGGDPDHALSAFGRMAAEAAFWTPAAILPGPGVSWEALDEATARVTLSEGALNQAVDMVVDGEGYPVEVVFQRWSDANPQRSYRRQPFGGVCRISAMSAAFSCPTGWRRGTCTAPRRGFPFSSPR